MRILSGYLCFVAALTFLTIAGCGGVNDGRVLVSGSVTLDGKPLDGGTIAFIGGGGGALATASTNKEGKFQMQVALGTNKVTISKDDPAAAIQTAPKSDADMLMGTDAQYKEQLKSMPKALVPAKYSKHDTSGLSFDVVAGMQPVSISLSSK
ncbi:MAG TPA: hypothetical protein VM260_07480 [Pirellula sp.]|nr:hypothetical protein [Pirellula sp.]